MLIRIYEKIKSIQSVITNSLLLILIFLTFLSAISRTFNFPLPWSLDLILLFFAWFTFLAAAQTAQRKRHMGVDLFTSKIPKKIQLYVSLFSHLVCIGFQVFIIIYGYLLCVTGSKRVVASLDCSYSLISASLVVGMVLMLLAEIEYLIKDINLLLHQNKEILG